MKIAVTGSSGLIGSALVPYLGSRGHEVRRVVRSTPRPAEGEIAWDPAQGVLEPASLAGLDAVIHLAGENLAGRWTRQKKHCDATPMPSRTIPTHMRCSAIFHCCGATRRRPSMHTAGHMR